MSTPRSSFGDMNHLSIPATLFIDEIIQVFTFTQIINLLLVIPSLIMSTLNPAAMLLNTITLIIGAENLTQFLHLIQNLFCCECGVVHSTISLRGDSVIISYSEVLSSPHPNFQHCQPSPGVNR